GCKFHDRSHVAQCDSPVFSCQVVSGGGGVLARPLPRAANGGLRSEPPPGVPPLDRDDRRPEAARARAGARDGESRPIARFLEVEALPAGIRPRPGVWRRFVGLDGATLQPRQVCPDSFGQRAERLPFALYSDYFPSPPLGVDEARFQGSREESGNPAYFSLEKMSVAAALDGFSGRFNRVWWRKGDALFFRSRSWF